ncbi:hypothetical protein [Flavobacterium sp.]|uniref:hypothetical protein n=1 Tax=Flavobacterium sp. TaxID=239 RepID=UPI0039E6B0F9
MSSPKNQTTLFRFQTLRSPELTDKQNQDIRFVFHPYNPDDEESLTGIFIEAVNTKPPTQPVWTALVGAIDDFVAFQSSKELEDFNDTFNTKAVWLSRNRSKFTPQQILEKLEPVDPLSDTEEILIWDNLFYQIVTQKSFYVKELILEWLVLQNTLKKLLNYPLPADKESVIMSLVNAKVILPMSLFGDDFGLGEGGLLAKAPEEDAEFHDSAKLDAVYNAFKAKRNVSKIEECLREIQKIEKKYKVENGKKYDKNYNIFLEEQQVLMAAYDLDYFETAHEMCAAKPPEGTPDFCKKPYVIPPNLPVFVFEPLHIPTYIKEKMPKRLYKVLDELFDHDPESFTEYYETLEEAMQDNNKLIANTQTFTSKTIMAVGGVVIPVNEWEKVGKIPFKLCINIVDDERFYPYMTIVLPENYEIASCSYVVFFNDGSSTPVNTYIQTHQFLGSVQIELLFGNPHGLPNSVSEDMKEISGTITFTNGVVKTFGVKNPHPETNPCIGNYLGDKSAEPGDETSADLDAFVPKGFGFRQLGVSDYKKVVQEICCYRAGEVAHIENIMAREFKEKSTEKITTEETTTFEAEDIETESLSDISSTQRFEMQTEIAKILQEQQQFEAHASVHASLGAGTTLDAGGSYASNVSKEESNRQAVTQAKEITERATERIVSRIRREKTVRVTETFKDTNRHIFDNRQGDEHVSGVYRFINAIYKNQVYNYGKRLMYEFMIPQPSKLHRLGKGASSSDINAQILSIPLDPRTNGLPDFNAVNGGNYMEYASRYSAEVNIYPTAFIYINKTFSGGVEVFWDPKRGGAVKEDFNLKIPEGYETVHAKMDASRDFDNTFYRSFGVSVGNIKSWMDGNSRTKRFNTEKPDNPILDNFRETISLSLQSLNNIGYNVAISIKCQLTNEGLVKWKKETFEAILEGYEQQMDEYNQKLAEIKANGVRILDSNPLFYRQIEQLVLRKNCISYLIDDTNTNSKRRFGRLMYNQGATFGNHQVNVDKDMDNYGSFAKFMEQAFEWNNISYNFYPFYWGNRTDWGELYQYESNDAIFRSFMQAGMARVVVTVRPGFEDAVMHYMTFGQIWNGGRLPILGDPLYLSIVDELREQEYVIEETWESVLPTNLIAIQSSGVSLAGEGLPCSPDCEEEGEENPIGNSTAKLPKPPVE